MGWDQIPTGAPRRGPLGYIVAFFFFFFASSNNLESTGDDCDGSAGGNGVDYPMNRGRLPRRGYMVETSLRLSKCGVCGSRGHHQDKLFCLRHSHYFALNKPVPSFYYYCLPQS